MKPVVRWRRDAKDPNIWWVRNRFCASILPVLDHPIEPPPDEDTIVFELVLFEILSPLALIERLVS